VKGENQETWDKTCPYFTWLSRKPFSKQKGTNHMSNITFHRRHMTAVPTDLLLDPTISIEAKAFAGILQAIPTGDHDLQELAVLLNVPDERIVPALSELSKIGFLTIEECDGIFHLNLW